MGGDSKEENEEIKTAIEEVENAEEVAGSKPSS